MKTFTQLVTGAGGFTDLSNNSQTNNISRGKALINDLHRYLIQKYFDNERTASILTVGGQALTLSGSLTKGATSAGIAAAQVWPSPTCTQLVNFSNGDQRTVLFTLNANTITWTPGLSSAATSAITTLGVQDYSIPANISKIKNDTINIGQLRYQPRFLKSRQEWDQINFLPYTSDIPNYCFIYNGKLSIFPIPSTTGNLITFNYKTRVADLTFADYSTGTLAAAGMAVGSTTVTGLASSWSTTGGYPTSTDLGYYNLAIRADPPYGDGIWYPISTFTSNTVLTTALPIVNAPNITSATTYTIGQLPLLQEDFQDMLVYGALMVYFNSILPDNSKYETYKDLYNQRLVMLEEYAGTKSVDVDLGGPPQFVNPNLFPLSTG